MTYRINVSEGMGPNWNNTGQQYSHYFAVKVEELSVMRRLVEDLEDMYPSPAYNITVTKSMTTQTEVFLK